MAKKPCVTHGCPALVPRGVTKCSDCAAKADRDRGSSTDRGYGTEHRERFREGVLAMQPVCVVCWSARATVADHYPLSRRDLVDAGEDPNDPKHGRGLCAPCHSKETAQHQPGGWHDRPPPAHAPFGPFGKDRRREAKSPRRVQTSPDDT